METAEINNYKLTLLLQHVFDLLIEPRIFRWIHLIQLMKNSPHSLVCEIIEYLLYVSKDEASEIEKSQ